MNADQRNALNMAAALIVAARDNAEQARQTVYGGGVTGVTTARLRLAIVNAHDNLTAAAQELASILQEVQL